MNVNANKLRKLKFPLPPLAEQGRIVGRIESLFSALDEARERLHAALDRLELWKTAVLREAVTGKLTAKWRASQPHAAPWSQRALKENIVNAFSKVVNSRSQSFLGLL